MNEQKLPKPDTHTIVEILPTKIWIESGIFGERVVVMQHDGHEPFDYAVFNYNYAYTSNAGTWEAANKLALWLGATEPIEQRKRKLPAEWAAAMKATP